MTRRALIDATRLNRVICVTMTNKAEADKLVKLHRRVRHPNILGLVGQQGNELFFPLVHGVPLVEEGGFTKMNRSEALSVLYQLALALMHMHSLGVALQCNLSDCMIIQPDGHVLLIDLFNAAPANGNSARLFGPIIDESSELGSANTTTTTEPFTNAHHDVGSLIHVLISLLTGGSHSRLTEKELTIIPLELKDFAIGAFSSKRCDRPSIATLIHIIESMQEEGRVKEKCEHLRTFRRVVEQCTWVHTLHCWTGVDETADMQDPDEQSPLYIASYYKPPSCVHLARATQRPFYRIDTDERRVAVAVALLCDRIRYPAHLETPKIKILKTIAVQSDSTICFCQWQKVVPAELRAITSFHGPKVIVTVLDDDQQKLSPFVPPRPLFSSFFVPLCEYVRSLPYALLRLTREWFRLWNEWNPVARLQAEHSMIVVYRPQCSLHHHPPIKESHAIEHRYFTESLLAVLDALVHRYGSGTFPPLDTLYETCLAQPKGVPLVCSPTSKTDRNTSPYVSSSEEPENVAITATLSQLSAPPRRSLPDFPTTATEAASILRSPTLVDFVVFDCKTSFRLMVEALGRSLSPHAVELLVPTFTTGQREVPFTTSTLLSDLLSPYHCFRHGDSLYFDREVITVDVARVLGDAIFFSTQGSILNFNRWLDVERNVFGRYLKYSALISRTLSEMKDAAQKEYCCRKTDQEPSPARCHANAD